MFFVVMKSNINRIEAFAAVSDGKTKDFKIEKIYLSPPEEDEVLVKIMASGICHTDYDSYTNPEWWGRVCMGHEGSGVVQQVGKKVSSVVVGDRVYLNWAIPCDDCYQCNNGQKKHL